MPMGRRPVFRSRRIHVDFELDRQGIAEIAVGPELRNACHDVVAHKALPYAISISPRSLAEHQHYQDSFIVQDLLVFGIPPEHPMTRVGTRLLNVVDHAAAVEWGNRRTPRGHHILRETLNIISEFHDFGL
jgi:hypothetical protein